MTLYDVQPATVKIGDHTYELHPALIEATHLGYEDHGIVTAWLDLDLATGGKQGAGLVSLSQHDEASDRQMGTAYGMDFVIQLLRAVGVEAWEHLPGKRVYALKREYMGRIDGLWRIDQKGEPFLIEPHFQEWRVREEEAT